MAKKAAAPARRSFPPAAAGRRTKPSVGLQRSQRAREAREATEERALETREARSREASPSTSANAAPPTGSSRLKVRATQMGFYQLRRRREGDVFILSKAKDFSPRWMEYTDGRTPLKHTGPQEAINRKHDEILGGTADRPSDPDAHADDDDVTT